MAGDAFTISSLVDCIAAGTPTSRFWFGQWVSGWSREHGDVKAVGNMDPHDLENLQNIHLMVFKSKVGILLECRVKEDKHGTYEGAKSKRWGNLMHLIGRCGKVGSILFQRTMSKSQKGVNQAALGILPVHIHNYGVCFANTSVFGDMSKYSYDPSDPKLLASMVVTTNQAETAAIYPAARRQTYY